MVSTGIGQIDELLGGLFVGDNIVWYDEAASLAFLFCQNFIKISKSQQESLIYVSFDRSPKNLLEKLGNLSENNLLTILDCFTFGKGEGAEVFLKFYEKRTIESQCQIILVKEPHNTENVMKFLYDVHKTKKGVVRFVFESLTGMQELWNGENQLLKFYSHSCPHLYELNTIAYWIIEKKAHSSKLKAHINKIAQVAIDLTLKRGKSFLTVLKAERRNIEAIGKPFSYWTKGADIIFEFEKPTPSKINLGSRLKEIRQKNNLSQKETASLVGVTSSTISQIESNQIYPSLPALLKLAEIFSIDISYFFQASLKEDKKFIFKWADAKETNLSDLPKENITGRFLASLPFESTIKPYLIDIAPHKKISGHFFNHKGEELGVLLSGTLDMTIDGIEYNVKQGDLIYLSSQTPAKWENKNDSPVQLLWVTVNYLL
ncbi:MAG: helix-turn-helix domain-containing protein [Desulfobacterales bacterium]|nr:helix-turn-helix domain-containing protein [Desulfobacterales bacterium]MBF0398390.1 helix-turn-helix domain-containing protein [Desulfobacterales bacterium]